MRKLENMVGKIFDTNRGDKCVIVEYKGCEDVTVEFIGDYTHRQTTYLGTLRRGCLVNVFKPSVRGVGYVGQGKYQPSIGGKHTKAYSMWKSAMTRSYCDNFHSKNPSYKGCTVCDEWHNFQNFAEWYYSHDLCGLGYDLDKDLLIKGNKEYSPKACTLLPSEINLLLASNASRRGKYPQGVSYDGFCDKYKVTLSAYGKGVNLGRYKNAEEAYEVYKKAKETYVKERALFWKDSIETKAFDALMNWKLDK